MELIIKKPTLRTRINKFVRISQRVEITKVSENATVVIHKYKNKSVIEVASSIEQRFLNKI